MGARKYMLIVTAGLALCAWTTVQAQVKENPTSPKAAPPPRRAAPRATLPAPPSKPAPQPTPPPTNVDPNQPHPQIAFDKTSNDFGVIDDDKPVSTEFKFSNTGSATLNIANTQGSCGCTVPALEKKDY